MSVRGSTSARVQSRELAEIEGQVKDEELDAEQEARRRVALAQIRQYPDAALKMAARPVEEFDDVHDFLFAVDALDAGAELQEAAGVGCDNDFGFYGGDVFHFVIEQFERRFRLRDVVDAGGATADVGVRKLG